MYYCLPSVWIGPDWCIAIYPVFEFDLTNALLFIQCLNLTDVLLFIQCLNWTWLMQYYLSSVWIGSDWCIAIHPMFELDLTNALLFIQCLNWTWLMYYYLSSVWIGPDRWITIYPVFELDLTRVLNWTWLTLQVFCIVPWEPPCDSDCGDVKKLLGYCHILLMSPDSYMPTVSTNGKCLAQATVPIASFLYGELLSFSLFF